MNGRIGKSSPKSFYGKCKKSRDFKLFAKDRTLCIQIKTLYTSEDGNTRHCNVFEHDVALPVDFRLNHFQWNLTPGCGLAVDASLLMTNQLPEFVDDAEMGVELDSSGSHPPWSEKESENGSDNEENLHEVPVTPGKSNQQHDEGSEKCIAGIDRDSDEIDKNCETVSNNDSEVTLPISKARSKPRSWR